jgi:ATP-dependent Clp protease ATP-binding subunit ClpC
MFGNRSSGMHHQAFQFAEDARALLAQARAESDRLRHEYLGTEHLVLALTRQPDGRAAAALRHLGIDLAGVQQLLEATVKPGHAAPAPDVERPYTSRTQKVFALAAQSAQDLGQTRVGAEHLVIGLMREGLNIGAQALHHHGLTAEAAADEIRRLAGDDGAH